jgi:RNA polymerase-binding transcription factor DksA
MNKKDTEFFKKKLLAEKAELEAELASVGQKNTSNPSGWDPTTSDLEVDSADENEMADKFEAIEGNTGIITQLQNQLKETTDALQKIENGNYGLCEVCGEPIERERLEANPGSRISIKHKH